MKRILIILILFFAGLFFSPAVVAKTKSRPNVLFIAVDDLNDWIQLLDKHAPIATPHLERLARRGVSFTRAYCVSPACNPSRVSVLTGQRPSSTGVYGNATDWRSAMPDAVTLPQAFMAAGYRVEGAGKLFHHHLNQAFHDEPSFHLFKHMPWPPDAPMPAEKLNQLPEFGSPNTDWGAWPQNESDALDVVSVDWCIERLKQPREKPLFLACGLFRPHMPFFAPQRWLDLYPTNRVIMPEILADDLADIPAGAIKLRKDAERFYKGIMTAEKQRPGSWREAVRCYQTAATFADAQIGRLLDALDASPIAQNTIIVLWSDHGYQLGEKECWEKFTLWEKATRVPFIIVAPGVTTAKARCDRPVSLLDIYPTLLELCGIPNRPELEGVSLVPLLHKPTLKWDRPAVMTYQPGNHAVRSERWRYIRYADATEELYDHENDPNEWRNVAGLPKNATVIAEMKRWLPKSDAPAQADMKR